MRSLSAVGMCFPPGAPAILRRPMASLLPSALDLPGPSRRIVVEPLVVPEPAPAPAPPVPEPREAPAPEPAPAEEPVPA